jgi:subtilisin family serine protease
VINRVLVDAIGRHVLITLAALSAAACAGGGGDGGGPNANISAPASPSLAPLAPPPPPPPGPSAASAEFTQNYALGAMHADAAFAAGATGAGVTVALIDTGVDGSGAELAGRVSPQSIDEDLQRDSPVGTDPHATWVAGVIADNFNGSGTVGVAYDSTILSIRADAAPSHSCSSGCIDTGYATSAIYYAISEGAKIVNMSFGQQQGTLGPAFEAALAAGVKAGIVFSISAGNDGNSLPTWPAAYAVDPRFAGSIIVAGALTQAGVLASYSNLAAGVQNLYIAAPGDQISTACVGSNCAIVSGTSFSAPAVAGSMALLLQAFPNLTGKQALNILLQTADDAGAPGTDAVYGRGILDLARAFQPIGAVAVAQVKGASVSMAPSPGASVSTAFGDAITSGGGLKTAGRDSYNRVFSIDLAQGYRSTAASIIGVLPAVQPIRSDVDLPAFGGGRLRISATLASQNIDPSQTFHWMLAPVDGGDVTVAYQHGGLTLTAWKGEGLANPFTVGGVDPFTALAQPDQAIRADFAGGALHVSAEAGSGQRLSPDRTRREDGSSYLRAAGQTRFGPVTATISGGELIEPLGPLGSYLPGESGFALPSRTGFIDVAQTWRLGRGVNFAADVSVGRTRLDGQFLSTPQATWSSAWQLGLNADCALVGLACSAIHLQLAQPLRVEAGRFQAILPDVPSDPSDPLTFSRRSFSASPSGREIDLRLQAERNLGAAGMVQVMTVAASQPGNRADAPLALGVEGGWRLRF